MSSISKHVPSPLALTMGDPAGIGPDITLLAWRGRRRANLSPFVLMGDPEMIAARAAELRLDAEIAVIDSPDAAPDLFDGALPVYPVRLPVRISPGKPEPACAAAIIESIDTGTGWVRQGKASALVTNPINKKLLTQAGFVHPGHTEYLAELCAEPGMAPPRPVMLLTSGDLRVVPATVHIPLKDVPGALSIGLIMETVEIAARGLRRFFGISSPRIGVTGLNPHSGEDGSLGREEIEIVTPAVDALRAKGFTVHGPLPADAAFQERQRAIIDVYVAMYHDQALIPVKTLAFDRTVNVTLGLPIVRTSPDHGTAYDLAGSGKANPGSLIESLRLAGFMAAQELADA